MKPDLHWPVPPRFGKPPAKQPKAELPPDRAQAVQRLSALAAIAESQVIPRGADGGPVLLPEDRPYRGAAGFVHWCLDQWERALLPAEGDIIGTSADLLAWARGREDVLVVREGSLHLVSAIRGDIAIFRDGHCGVVTHSQCAGCRHFGMAAHTRPEEVPSVVQVEQAWLVNVKALIRIVLPVEAQPPPKDEGGRRRAEKKTRTREPA